MLAVSQFNVVRTDQEFGDVLCIIDTPAELLLHAKIIDADLHTDLEQKGISGEA